MRIQTIKTLAFAIAVTACATEDMEDDPAGEMEGEELWDEGPTPELDAVQPDEEIVTDVYAASPLFQLPFPCNQTWAGQTRTNHSPQLSIDFNRANDTGDTVVASAAGTVTRVANEGNVSYGRWVEVRHGNGFTTRYAHLSTQSVSVGQTVNRGQRLGTVGTTGGSTGPHLHFELRQNGIAVRAKFNGATALYFGTKNYKSANGCSGGGGGATGRINTESGVRLTVRAGASTSSAAIGTVGDGTFVTISCQKKGTSVTGTYGTSNLWDKIGDGYVADAYVFTGTDGRVAPDCP
jgi:biotin carboxyl carrier protein